MWKSNNQGVKEDTFIQTARRDGDGQLGGEDSCKMAAGGLSEAADCGVGWARQQLADPATDQATQGSSLGK